MGTVLWMLAAVGTLWVALEHVIAVDGLLFIVTIILAALFAIKAVADGIESIGAVGESFGSDDFDD